MNSHVTEDILVRFQNGYDGVLEEFSVELLASRAGVRGEVVLALVSPDQTWTRLRLKLHEISKAQFSQPSLVGGGGVLYDGGRLQLTAAGEFVLNLDPGVGWAATGTLKAEEESNFLLRGRGELTLAPISR